MRGKPRPALTREAVTRAALRLLDEAGLEGLTTRRLAAELGVQSPALYWHFRTKQDLLDDMAEALIVAAGLGPPHAGESWSAWLMRRARAYRASLLAHRDGARLVANARRLSPAAIAAFNEELTAMLGFGFTPVLALRTITALSNYVTGCVLREQARPRVDADGPRVDAAALAGLTGAGPSAPLVVAIREGGSPSGEGAFDFGLRALIDGATAALERKGPSRSRTRTRPSPD
jgi:TetR/AcrR family transcriptional regulator, tetracycline repressor protein